jgi:hypothetical protein
VTNRLETNGRAVISFITFARMPSVVYHACVKTGTVSNTRYIQEAVCEKLSRDLGIPIADLLAELPPPRGPAAHQGDGTNMNRYGKDRRVGVALDQAGGVILTGPANTFEQVR